LAKQDAGREAGDRNLSHNRPQEADMLKHVMAVTAVSAFALTSALAQTSSPPASSDSKSSPPAAASTTTPPPAASPTTPSPSASTTTPAKPTASTAAASGKFITKQTSDQYLMSKFKGTDVIGTDDKKIGDVSDILFDKEKKILAYIVGVGGFLGIGSKDVALEPAAFQMVPGSSATDFKLRLSMTKDELKEAPAFEPYKEARPATTSSNAPTRPMGAPAPTAPPPKQ
jgi:sporulation protein YlmC with PRC-barrel domain